MAWHVKQGYTPFHNNVTARLRRHETQWGAVGDKVGETVSATQSETPQERRRGCEGEGDTVGNTVKREVELVFFCRPPLPAGVVRGASLFSTPVQVQNPTQLIPTRVRFETKGVVRAGRPGGRGFTWSKRLVSVTNSRQPQSLAVFE